jgi:hypothetical protein
LIEAKKEKHIVTFDQLAPWGPILDNRHKVGKGYYLCDEGKVFIACQEETSLER